MTASKIEWTDRSDWNPIRGCTRVSPGCGGPGDAGGCYAEAIAARFSDPGLPPLVPTHRTIGAARTALNLPADAKPIQRVARMAPGEGDQPPYPVFTVVGDAT